MQPREIGAELDVDEISPIGNPISILELMNLENTVTFSQSGVVTEWFVAEGDSVTVGDVHVRLR
jgi:biotin carboxyl carrier protein